MYSRYLRYRDTLAKIPRVSRYLRDTSIYMQLNNCEVSSDVGFIFQIVIEVIESSIVMYYYDVVCFYLQNYMIKM